MVSASPVLARPIRVATLDNDATGSTTVVVGTITRIRAYPPAGSKAGLVPLALDVRVDAAIHLPVQPGGRVPKRIVVTHTRRRPSALPLINAFSPVELRFGRTYVLFLHRDGRQSGVDVYPGSYQA